MTPIDSPIRSESFNDAPRTLVIPASFRRPLRVLKKSAHLELSSLVFQTGEQQRAAVDGAMRTLSEAFKTQDYAHVFRSVIEAARSDGSTVSVPLTSANTQLHALNEATSEFALGYEPEVASLIDTWVPEGGTFIDVGANFGYFSLFLLCRPAFSGRIHAFEPSARAYADLEALLAQIDRQRRVVAHRIALGDRDGEGTLYQSQSDGLSTVVEAMANRREPVTQESRVRIKRLDDFTFERVDLVKIDAEGSECQVIQGAAATLERFRPPVVFETWVSCDDAEVFSQLAQFGYRFFVPGWKTRDGKLSISPVNAHALGQLTLLQFELCERSKLPERFNVLALPCEKAEAAAGLSGP